jgi:hypothetical protein
MRVSSVWGSSRSDVFAVGYSGQIIHYDGSIWSKMNSGTTDRLTGVWGSSDSDVFAVGYAVGQGGIILHYDGSAWSVISSETTHNLSGAWGSSGSDVFAVGSFGTILHYDGNAWSEMSSGTTNSPSEVWGSSGSDVFVVGSNGTILHYGGNDITPKGDLSGDGVTDLTDAIIALKVLTGQNPPQLRTDYTVSGADVNGDNRVGTEELIYILQEEAELR